MPQSMRWKGYHLALRNRSQKRKVQEAFIWLLTSDSIPTPLMWAADFDQPHTVELLLERGANPSLTNKDGLTALDFALESGHEEVVALLEAHSAEE